MNFLLVFTGGGLGSLLRYLIGIGTLKIGFSLPWATFTANIIACVVLALTLRLALVNAPENVGGINMRLLIITGFCGGLSTFSTFSYETFLMLKQGLYLFAFLNIIVSIGICLFAFYAFNRQTA